MIPKTAFILGAGLGTRLRPLTNEMPKPLLPIGGKLMIHYAMDHLIEVGVERFIINTHHCASCYRQSFPENHYRNIPIIYSHEPVLLDTGGGLAKIRHLVNGDEQIWIYNADILCNADLNAFLKEHNERKAITSLLLRHSGSKRNVTIDKSHNVIAFDQEKNYPDNQNHQFTGISIIRKSFFDYLPEQDGSMIFSLKDTWNKLIRENQNIHARIDDTGYWHDLGTLDEYYRINKSFASVKN